MARTIKESLRSGGSNPYNNYNKSGYRLCVQKLSDGKIARETLDEETRTQLDAQARADLKPTLSAHGLELPDIRKLADRVRAVCARTVVASTIAALEADEPLASWVRTGLHIHNDRDQPTCLFCEQSLPQERIARLQAHFSDEYERLMMEIESEANAIDDAIKRLSHDALPRTIEFYPDLGTRVEAARTRLLTVVDTRIAALNSLRDLLRTKQSKPFVVVEVLDVATGEDDPALKDFATLIDEHNRATEEFTPRVEAARQRLEAALVSAELNTYGDFLRARDSENKAEDLAKAEVDRLEDKIALLEGEIVEHRAPAEELNADLAKYLGTAISSLG